MTRICLTMIVKNESAIIERCLLSALPYIDTWCITDTGSTDGTATLIESFFSERKINGRLERSTFKNFAQARNDGLRYAQAMPGWDYALLIDADMVVTGTLDKSSLTAPAYNAVQRNGFLDYSNTRLVKRDAHAAYIGVTHEYLSVDGVEHTSGLIIDDRDDGGSKSDKGDRDIRLLNDGLVKEPDNGRYMFYLAQTYREMGRHQEAIHWYRRRIELGGWDEEIWASHYGLARSFKEIKDESNFVKSCLDAYAYRPVRGESLKLLARFYREEGRNELAMIFAESLSKIERNNDYLFVERDVYDFGAAQEISIAGYHSRVPSHRAAGYRACADLTVHHNDFVRGEALRNFTFYAKPASELFGATTSRIKWTPEDGWAPMNPSVVVGYTGLKILVRTVNYTVTDGQYPTNDGSDIIRTRNYVLEMSNEDPLTPILVTEMEDATEIPRTGFPVEGFEDCRLWANEDSFFVSATVRDFPENSDGVCEMAIIRLDEKWRAVEAIPVRAYEHEKTQKNWMPIVGHPFHFLYLCDPTIVIDTSFAIVPNTINVTEIARHESPVCLKDLRGGSQLISFDKGWLCVTHEVAWRPERVYLHRFVKFNLDFKVVAISDPFYFDHVGIEFCAGLAMYGNRLIASYGVNDASARLAFFNTDNVKAVLTPPI